MEADTSSHATVPAISDPTLLATDLNIASITPKLTPGNVVELVLQNIVSTWSIHLVESL